MKCEDRAFAPPPVYACEKCNDLGLVPDMLGTRWLECQCAVRKRQERILCNAGFDLDAAHDLADYKPWTSAAAAAKYKAGDFAERYDDLRKRTRNWFLISGQSGSGKTMLGRAIVKALVQRTKPVRAKAVKYYEMIQRLKSKSNDENYCRFLSEYTEPELLFIDDLLKEKARGGELTEADTKHLFAVIDSRYESRLPTIITTECTMGRLDELDEAIYSRMHERAFAEIVFFGGEANYRKRS